MAAPTALRHGNERNGRGRGLGLMLAAERAVAETEECNKH